VLAWRLLLEQPALASLAAATLLFGTAHAMLESLLALWALHRFDFGPKQVGLLQLMIGFVLVAMQGGGVGRLTERFGERPIAVAGIVFYLCGLALLAAAGEVPLVLVGGVLCGLGLGAYNPSVSSLVSKLADPAERGVVMGTYQSSLSLARIVGPSLSGALYAGIATNAPFLVGIAVSLPAIWLILHSRQSAAVAASRGNTQ
jgi:MFS family permease